MSKQSLKSLNTRKLYQITQRAALNYWLHYPEIVAYSMSRKKRTFALSILFPEQKEAPPE